MSQKSVSEICADTYVVALRMPLVTEPCAQPPALAAVMHNLRTCQKPESVEGTILEHVFDPTLAPLAAAGVDDTAATADLPPTALMAAVESSYRLESMLIARRLAAVAGLLRHRVAAAERAEREHGYAMIDGFEQTTAEVAAAMNLSPMAASYLVCHAEALDVRLPKVAALLADGRTHWRTVRLIMSRTDLVSDDGLMAKLDDSLAARIANWHSWSKQRIVNAVDAAVRVADPTLRVSAASPRKQARYIEITAQDNGMAEVYGTVAAAAATAFDRRLSQLAKQVCAADPRTLDQRRADALAALTEGRRLACACGQPECPESSQRRRVRSRSDRDTDNRHSPSQRANCQWSKRSARLFGGLRRHRCRASAGAGRDGVGTAGRSANK